jgi:hypothetical protein
MRFGDGSCWRTITRAELCQVGNGTSRGWHVNVREVGDGRGYIRPKWHISRLSNIIEAGGGTRVIHVEESVMFLYRFLVRGFYCPDLGSSVPENAAQRRRTAGE